MAEKSKDDEPITQQDLMDEMEDQPRLLRSINSKLGFFVVITIIYILISIAGVFIR